MIQLRLNRSQVLILLSATVLLLIPLIAMQFTEQVQWSPFDFVIMSVLLIGFGWLGEWGWRKYPHQPIRWLLVALVVLLFILVWAELAVGIFGSPLAGS